MKKTKLISVSTIALFAFFTASAQAVQQTVNNVPYLHQVLDMNQTEFLGYNACGPTSTAMILRFHKLQPEGNYCNQVIGPQVNRLSVYTSYDCFKI